MMGLIKGVLVLCIWDISILAPPPSNAGIGRKLANLISFLYKKIMSILELGWGSKAILIGHDSSLLVFS